MSQPSLPRSLLWKELRSLLRLAPPLIAFEVGCWIFLGKLLREPATLPAGWPTVETWAAASWVLWGILLGVALWGLEREADTYPLLASLPIHPGRMVLAKALASGIGLACVVLARWVVLGAGAELVDGIGPLWGALTVGLAWLAGSWLVTTHRPLGVGLTLLFAGWVGPRLRQVWTVDERIGPVVAFGGVVLLATLLVRDLRQRLAGGGSMESPGSLHGRWRAGSASLQPATTPRPRTLGWLERSLFAPSWVVLLAIPVLLMLWPRARAMPWLFFLPIPWLTAWHAASILPREERAGSGFFLHTLPIPWTRLIGRRLALALLLGPILVLESTGLATLCTWLGVTDPLWQPSTSVPTMAALSLGMATVTTLLATALTPWLPQRLLVVALSGVHLILLVLLEDNLGGLDNPWTLVLLLLPHLAATRWSLVQRPTLGGDPRHARWALLILVGFWCLLLLLAR